MSLSIAVEPVPLAEDRDGVVRVAKTRVTLDSVISAFWEGATAEEVSLRYPSLALADVYTVLGYYLRHRDEVDHYLRQRQAEADSVRLLNESRFDPTGVRERLIERSRNRGK